MEPASSAVFKLLSPVLKPISRVVLGFVSGFRSPQVLAVRRYRHELRKRHSKFIPRAGQARTALDMRERYLPLRVEDKAGRKLDIEKAITDSGHLVIIGEPGAGKSLILEKLAFEFAVGDRAARQRNIPVILRFVDVVDAPSLRECLVARLRAAGFFKPEKFAKRMLDKGLLRILLDGLDEVTIDRSDERSRDQRGHAVTLIQDFVREFPECEVVVTCRSSVEEQALWRQMTVLKIAELDDQLVRRYVVESVGTQQASTDVLLEELFGAPRVLALARVPLLLHMMVDMYGGSDGRRARIPASRAQFYGQAADFLLTPTRGEEGTDQERKLDKETILRDLALSSHDSVDKNWLTIDRETAHGMARARFGGGADESSKLFNQIVEGSGLLRREHQQYRYAHLTFQEYFAAEALRERPAVLVERYLGNPDRWHNVVVLWCGIVVDATPVPRDLLDRERLVALECVSEAKQMDDALVERIIGTFGSMLDRAGPDSPAVRAFGAAASGAEGRRVFEFLYQEVVHGHTEARRRAAAHALTASNLPEAAVELGKLYQSVPEVHAPLARMGDFAVDAIAKSATYGDVSPLDGLVAIGSPAAASALVTLLWNNDEYVAAHAAWRVGAMIKDKRIEDSLREEELPANGGSSAKYGDVWRPFTRSAELQRIIARVGYLICEGPLSSWPSDDHVVDPRLAIALGFFAQEMPVNRLVEARPHSTELDSVVAQMGKHCGAREFTRYKRKLPPRLLENHSGDRTWANLQTRLIDLHLVEMRWPEPQRTLLRQVSAESLTELFSRYGGRSPSLYQWAHMHDRTSRLARSLLGLGVLTALEALGLVVLTVVLIVKAFFITDGFTLEPLLQIGSFAGVMVEVGKGVIGILPAWHIWVVSLRWLVTVIVLGFAAVWVYRHASSWRAEPFRNSFRLLAVAGVLLPLVVSTGWLHTNLGSWGWTVAVWVALLVAPGTAGVLYKVYKEHQDNPIRGGLEKYTSRRVIALT